MALQIIPTFVNLTGDGVTTSFVVSYASIKGFLSPANAGLFPVTVMVNNPPVSVSSALLDNFGNTTLTLSSAPASGVQNIFELDFTFPVPKNFVCADSYNQTVVSDVMGEATIMQAILYELRAIKSAVIQSTKPGPLNENDFLAQNFANDWDDSIN